MRVVSIERTYFSKFRGNSQIPQNLMKMLRKSPASNAWVAAFKNADFSYSSKPSKF